MPSCVVKLCKNNSMDVKKETGVTFHKFPKDINWKHKWIKVVRACRNQESWLPSKFSVVCSAHFEDGDIYTTQGGNRRITKHAVPKLKLYDKTPKRKKNEHSITVENVSVSVQTICAEPVNDEDLSIHTEVITGDPQESVNRIENVIIKVEPEEMMETTTDNGTQTDDQDQNITKGEAKEQAQSPIEVSIDPLAPQHVTENDIDLLADTSHYEQEIKRKKEQLKICRKKIKILHQKVSRLKKRNLKLKSILKEIRYKKLIDKNIFRQLTAGLVNNDD